MELADGLRDGGKLEVICLTGIPEQTDLDALDVESPRITSIRRRILATGQERQLPLEFEAIVSHDIVKTIHEISGQLHCHWLVLNWGGRRRESFTVRNPLGWLKDHISANLAIFYDAGVRYIREILVYARHDAHDDLVVDTAEHLSKVHDARLTFVEYIPDSAGENVVSSESDYLEQIRAACNAPSEAIIVRGSNEVAAIGQASAAYDLLVMADSQERSLLTAIRGSHADRVTEVAGCSVLRLQSPHRRPDR